MTQSYQLYRTNNGPCPYRDEGTWENISFEVERFSPQMYQDLLNQGYRRSGRSVYHPICQNCKRCIPIRINANKFAPNKGQRRTWKKNQDLHIEHRPVEFSQKSFELYQRYQEEWHHVPTTPSLSEFQSFLIESPVETEMIHFLLDQELIGVSWVDRLPSSISSVYFIFNPDYASRRLGVYSILYEIKYCQQLKLPWLYLGYWVEDSQKMQYKANYHPAEILCENQWQSID